MQEGIPSDLELPWLDLVHPARYANLRGHYPCQDHRNSSSKCLSVMGFKIWSRVLGAVKADVGARSERIEVSGFSKEPHVQRNFGLPTSHRSEAKCQREDYSGRRSPSISGGQRQKEASGSLGAGHLPRALCCGIPAGNVPRQSGALQHGHLRTCAPCFFGLGLTGSFQPRRACRRRLPAAENDPPGVFAFEVAIFTATRPQATGPPPTTKSAHTRPAEKEVRSQATLLRTVNVEQT